MHKKIFLLGVVLFFQASAATALPVFRVFSSSEPKYKAGQVFGVGQFIRTGKGKTVTGDLRWSGIKYFSVLPGSQFKFTEYGIRGEGGRATRIDIEGEVIIEVSVTNPQSVVKVCFLNFWNREGCSDLRSNVRYQTSEGVVGVSEGNVVVTPGDVRLKTGQYSVLGKDGVFSPPLNGFKGGTRLAPVGGSKTIKLWETLPGWKFFDGSTEWSGPVLPPLVSPLESVPLSGLDNERMRV